jgi:hypothetical protein
LWWSGILNLWSPEIMNPRRSGIMNLRNSEIESLWNLGICWRLYSEVSAREGLCE